MPTSSTSMVMFAKAFPFPESTDLILSLLLCQGSHHGRGGRHAGQVWTRNAWVSTFWRHRCIVWVAKLLKAVITSTAHSCCCSSHLNDLLNINTLIWQIFDSGECCRVYFGGRGKVRHTESCWACEFFQMLLLLHWVATQKSITRSGGWVLLMLGHQNLTDTWNLEQLWIHHQLGMQILDWLGLLDAIAEGSWTSCLFLIYLNIISQKFFWNVSYVYHIVTICVLHIDAAAVNSCSLSSQVTQVWNCKGGLWEARLNIFSRGIRTLSNLYLEVWFWFKRKGTIGWGLLLLTAFILVLDNALESEQERVESELLVFGGGGLGSEEGTVWTGIHCAIGAK